MWDLLYRGPWLPFDRRSIALFCLALYSAACLAVLAWLKWHAATDVALADAVHDAMRALLPSQSLVVLPALLFSRDVRQAPMDERERAHAHRAAYATVFVLLIGLIALGMGAVLGPRPYAGLGLSPATLACGIFGLYFLGFLTFAATQLVFARVE